MKLRKQPQYRNEYPIYTEEEREKLGLTAGEMFYVGEKLLDELGIPYDITSTGGSGIFWYTWSYQWVKACGHWPMCDVDRDRVMRLLAAGRDDPSVRPAMEAVSKKYWGNNGSWYGDKPMVVVLEEAIGITVGDDWRSILRELDRIHCAEDGEDLDAVQVRLQERLKELDESRSGNGDAWYYQCAVHIAITDTMLAVVEAAQRGRKQFPFPPTLDGGGPLMDAPIRFTEYVKSLQEEK